MCNALPRRYFWVSFRIASRRAMTAKSPPIADRICAAIMLALAALVLGDLVFGLAWAAPTSRIAFVALVPTIMARFGLREWMMTLVAVALGGGLALGPDGAAHLGEGIGKAAYFTAFILVMMLLREAAVTSASVLEVGTWITRQPPGRRFYATWVGGHAAAVLLNFGAVSLLAPLIQRGARANIGDSADDRRRATIIERRQLAALVRGFAPVFCWAPTTLTQVIIFGAVPGLEIGTAITMGLGLSAILLVVARVEDRLRWGRPQRRGEQAPPFPGRAGLDLLAVYVFLVGGSLAVQSVLHGALPLALMTVAPILLVGWVILQDRLGTLTGQGAGGRLAQIALVSVPRGARDAYLLGCAGFIGIAAAQLAPVDLIALWLEDAHLPAWAIVAALPVVITLGGQIGLAPMVMVVFLAAVVSALPELPAEPEFIAGWSLSMTASPNATGAILLSGVTGLPTTTLTWRWNGVYSLMVLAVLTALSWLFVA